VPAWRDWLEAHEVRQPFMQAHREIYLLTDTERAAGTYSNRFAAHLIKQHRFAMLCRQRGWRYTLQGEWDPANTPTIDHREQGAAPRRRSQHRGSRHRVANSAVAMQPPPPAIAWTRAPC